MTQAIISMDGIGIESELDFHVRVAAALDSGPYYGKNLDALWDMLSSGAGGGITLVWRNSEESRQRLGSTFEKIVALFEKTKARERELALPGRFDYKLE